MRSIGILRCVVMLGGLVPLVAQALAAEPSSDPTFSISRFEIQGGTLISPIEIEERLKPYLGEGRRFSDVESARQAVLMLYAQHGFPTVDVILPEQEVMDGTIHLKVLERRVARIMVTGDPVHGRGNILRSVPELQVGAVPNSVALSRGLRLANDNPSKQTYLLFKAGDKPDEVETFIKLEEEPIRKFFVSLDNTGNRETGESRLAVGLQHANVADRDQVLTVQYITSPEKPEKVSIFGAGYRVPLYSLGDALDFFAGHSDVDSGNVQGLFNVSGRGTILGARYSHWLPRSSNYEHKLGLGIDYRAYSSQVSFSGQPLGGDVTVHPVSLTYDGLLEEKSRRISGYVTLTRNIPGGSDGDTAAFNASRVGAKADYDHLRYGGSWIRYLASDWQVRAGFDGQYSDQPLVSAEQFGLGGQDSLRGVDERIVIGDKGWRASAELYGPDLGGKTGYDDAHLRLFAFTDAGHVHRINVQPGEHADTGLLSVGLGLRFGRGKQFSFRCDYGYVLDGGGLVERGHARAHAALAYVF